MVSRRWLVLPFTLLLLFLPFLVSAQDIQSEMKKADTLWAERGDIQKAKNALDAYDAIMIQDPSSYDAAWKCARACYWVGLNSDKEEGKAAFEKGIEAAKKAIAIKDDDPAGHFWLGVNYGKYGEAKGIFKSLSLVDPTKEEMNKVLELDPMYEGGGAYRVLGRVYSKLPGFLGGSKTKAVENLKKAIEMQPDRLINHVFLAEVYMKMDENEKAKDELNFVLNAPLKQGYEPESKFEKAQAQELLKEIS